jgi:DNA polymerase sigma
MLLPHQRAVSQQAGEFPALRPLVLVLKCVLGQAGLNDASKGGLSSFALANMALASLQEDAKVRTPSSQT